MADMDDSKSGSLEMPEDAGKGAAGVVARWKLELALASDEEKFWRENAKDALERYRDESGEGKNVKRYSTDTRFNILYSQVQTLVPALYNKTPAPDVRRRYRDQDPVGKEMAEVMERALSYTMDAGNFDDDMIRSVKDSQIVGRGLDRVRYKPTIEKQTTEDGEEFEAVTAEEACTEHVQWDDFRRGPARSWPDVPWIAFRHRLRKDKAEAMLGGKLPVDIEMDAPEGMSEDDQQDELSDTFKRLTVWEIWDKDERKVIWICPSYNERPLRTDDDPLELEGFFPCPEPLYAATDASTLTPVEPYRYYADQAEELDEITKRITKIIKVMKWRGIYGATIEEMAQLRDASDGELVPSESIITLMANGGIDKAIWMMPIEQAAQALQSLYLQREQIKQVIFEITGLADIMRGSSNASETLGAQQLKAQFGTMRLDDMRRAVQNYARDLVRLLAEVMAEHFQPQTVSMMTGMEITPEMTAILVNDGPRGFRIDIETDSTVAGDVAEEQKNMTEMLGGIAQYVTAMGPAVQSGMFPMDAAKALLLSATRRFKLGREVEDAIDQIGGQNGPDGVEGQEQPDPAMQAAEAEAMQAQQAEAQAAQQAQADAQMKQQEVQMKAQEASARFQAEQEKAARDHEFAREQHRFAQQQHADKMQLELRKLDDTKAATHARVMDGEVVDNDPLDTLAELARAMLENQTALQQGQQAIVDALQAVIGQQTAPREVLRDAEGKVIGVAIKGGPTMNLVRENGRPVGIEVEA